MKKYAVATAAAAALLSAAHTASAAVVMFGVAPPAATTFADGTFSSNLSGVQPDGFYGVGNFAAYNGYGQNGEYIHFKAPVTLNSLKIGACTYCFDSHPAIFTVNLYNAGSVLIDSKSITASSTEETLTFDRPNTTKVEFTFEGADGSNPYGDGRDVAWYQVRDIFYSEGVPEPAIWALMIGGFGLVGGELRRRRSAVREA